MPQPSDSRTLPSDSLDSHTAAALRFLAPLLAGLAMLGPFSVDTYLPAFPSIQAALGATEMEVQQTLTAYMFSFGAMILWHGALSDAFGRRNVVLGALAVFALASLGCAASHSVGWLWAFRVLQGVSAGAGVVIGRAIIRDLYADARATRLLSTVTMIFSLAPAIAPILGGWVVKLVGWRAIFLFLFFYTVLLLWACWQRLPETLPPEKRRPLHVRSLARHYLAVFRSPPFQLKAGTLAFNFAGLFLYIAAAPAFITRHLHLGPSQFGWQFIPAVSGIFLGALSANRLAGRLPIPRQVALGFVLMVGASVANVLYHAFFPPAVPWSVMPLFFYTFGMSMTAPVVTLLILDLFPENRGLVASCQSFTQTILAAAVAGAIAPFLLRSALWLALGQLAFSLIALALWCGARAHRRLSARRRIDAWEAVE
ncbi:MAG: multidrug effflux MFS transporter [Burkholderiaceae bacterium]